MEPLVQLEEESEKLLGEIIFEDNIVLSTEGLLEVDRHLFLRLCFYRCSEAPVLSSPSCTVPVVRGDERVRSHPWRRG